MMGTREMPGSDQMYLGNPNVDPGAGQAQGGIGTFTGGNLTATLIGGDTLPGLGGGGTIDNMNDLYAYYSQMSPYLPIYSDYFDEDGNQMSFIDFLNSAGQMISGDNFFSEGGVTIGQSGGGGTTANFQPGGGGMGAQGGAGDLGFGNMFAGGAFGTEGFALNEPDTSIIDPSADQQCLAAFQTYGQEYGSYEEFANAMC